MAQEQQKNQWTKIGVGAAVVLLIAGIGFWVLKRRQEEEIEVLTMEADTSVVEADQEDVETASQEAIAVISELSQEEKTRNAEMEAIETLSKAKPEEVAMLLKTWLTDE